MRISPAKIHNQYSLNYTWSVNQNNHYTYLGVQTNRQISSFIIVPEIFSLAGIVLAELIPRGESPSKIDMILK